MLVAAGITLFHKEKEVSLVMMRSASIPHCYPKRLLYISCLWVVGGIWSVPNDKIFTKAASHIIGRNYYLQEGTKAAALQAKASRAGKFQC